MVKKAENFSEVKSDAIKSKRLEEELRKTKQEKEKIYEDFMEYKYDHMPSDIKRWLDKCYRLLTWEASAWSKRRRFKIEFMEFCEWNCFSKKDYEEAKKKKAAWAEDWELTKIIDEITLPFE